MIQPSWRMIEFRGVTTTWPWTGLPHSYGHGPQLTRRARRSVAPTVPLPSSEAKNPRPGRAGGVMVERTRRGPLTWDTAPSWRGGRGGRMRRRCRRGDLGGPIWRLPRDRAPCESAVTSTMQRGTHPSMGITSASRHSVPRSAIGRIENPEGAHFEELVAWNRV